MILGGSALGVTIFGGSAGFPQPSEYQSVEIFGSGIFDNVTVKNIDITEEEIKLIDPTVTPVWDGNTLLLATFNDLNLDGGSVGNITNPVLEFDVNRRKTTETVFTKLATVDVSVSNYIDVTAEPSVTYIYQILAKNASEISQPLQADPFDSDFYNHLLIDEDDYTVFIFNLNARTDGDTNETAYQRYDGYNQFSSFSFGDRDFLVGNVSAVVNLDDFVCTEVFSQTIEYIDLLRAFINNKKEKIYKSRKGRVLRVITTDYNDSPVSDKIGKQPYNTSFTFTEVGVVHGS